jgi:tetratricopeptide (TPR) repeat protein
MAVLELKRGNNEKAMKNYMTMLEMQGNEEPCKFFEEKANEYKRKDDYVMQAVYLEGMINCKGDDADLGDYYNLGYAYYREKNYEAAIPVFTKCTELKPDWEAGWYFKASCMHNNTPDDPGYSARQDFEEVFNLLSVTPIDELKTSEASHLKTAATYLAFYHFYPEKKDAPTADDYHCEAAQSYVKKVLELDPDDKTVTQITGYCEQAGGGR